MAKFIKSLQIEEIVLGSISLFFLALLYSLGFFSGDIKLIFEKGLVNIAPAFQLWTGGVLILALWIYPLFIITINRKISFSDYFRREKIKGLLAQGLLFLKTFAIIITTTALGILTSGLLQQETKNRLANLQLLNADKILTGGYPLFWLHSPANILSGFFDFFTPAIIYSFLSLTAAIGILAFIFYFGKNKNIFKGYVMSISIVFALAMPFWLILPANSPANYFLHGSGSSSSADIAQAISDYRPNARVAAFQEKIWREQKNSQPVTTMPSMHWAWSIIIVYYLFKKERKTIALSSLWLAFGLFGTIYLGNHYLIDGLVAVPLAVLSVFLAELCVRSRPTQYSRL